MYFFPLKLQRYPLLKTPFSCHRVHTPVDLGNAAKPSLMSLLWDRHCDTMGKMLLEATMSHIRVPGLKCCLLNCQFQHPVRQQRMASVLGSQSLMWKTQLWFLASDCHGLSYWEHWRRKIFLSFFSFCLLCQLKKKTNQPGRVLSSIVSVCFLWGVLPPLAWIRAPGTWWVHWKMGKWAQIERLQKNKYK